MVKLKMTAKAESEFKELTRKCKFEVDGKCDNPENEYAGFECILLDPYLPTHFRCEGFKAGLE